MLKAKSNQSACSGASNPKPASVSYFFISIMSHLFHKEEAIRQITSYANTQKNPIYIGHPTVQSD